VATTVAETPTIIMARASRPARILLEIVRCIAVSFVRYALQESFGDCDDKDATHL
jgi:hypothetical protein